ncbi:hypothetical protein RRG08_066493 [Elysia crispata]|uniref:Uncharacterized protein n=1 Tax=Elysia crispata TaxID=231223 RepID=A0AAE0ZDW6_9GAST|nr:hypothetical protein RRG08_066493 [Elysia crispata]
MLLTNQRSGWMYVALMSHLPVLPIVMVRRSQWCLSAPRSPNNLCPRSINQFTVVITFSAAQRGSRSIISIAESHLYQCEKGEADKPPP